MRMYVQWAMENPEDWDYLDSSEWENLPTGPVPSNETKLPYNERMYINQLNVQGVTFGSYDHYAVEDNRDESIRVTCWNDDIEDYPGDFHAITWTFYPLQYDPAIRSMNTMQTWIAFIQSETRKNELKKRNIDILKYIGDWDEFEEPDPWLIRHGIWMPDEVFDKSAKITTVHGWREWA